MAQVSTYAVGDIQGCYEPLRRLLDQLNFEPADDQLWLVGDLVNRGPDSLAVLRYAASLGNSLRVVLGNHDLHLLAVASGVRALRKSDSLTAILDASDVSELLSFLRRQPLLYHDPALDFCMVHAGIPPQWDLATAQAMAREAEYWLRDHGYGICAKGANDRPGPLLDSLDAEARARLIVAYFTRMRVCTPEGKLHMAFKGDAAAAPPGHAPWYSHPGRRSVGTRILFGHWAALRGRVDAEGVFGLDTGCVWGNRLTLMRLEDQKRFECKCPSC